jgi:hypothetical protein
MPVAPDFMRSAARKALSDREDLPKSRKAGTLVGLARANQLVKGENLSLSTLYRIRSFLLRHRENYRQAKAKGLNNTNSKVIQAVNLWGGMKALGWVNKQIEKSR